MMRALTFGAGLAVGYVFGTKAGRQRYEQLKHQVGKVWQNPRTQEKLAGAKESIKDMVPEVKERLHLSGHKDEGTSAANQELDPESGTANSSFSGQDTGTGPGKDSGS